MFQMIEEGEIICLDDAESDDDIGGGQMIIGRM